MDTSNGAHANAANAQYNRFIPNRTAMDIENARFQMKGGFVGLSNDNDAVMSEDNGTEGLVAQYASEDSLYQGKLAQACGIGLNTKILSFNRAPLLPDDTEKMPTAVLNGGRFGGRIASNSSLGKRNVRTEPTKVLDAPGIVDDYYLHLLDWSSGNVLGVVLGESVFLWEAASSGVCKLMDSPEQQYVASLKFSTDGNFLALGTAQGTIQIWDVRNRKKVRTMDGHPSRVGVLAWNGHVLCSGSLDGSIWHHDVRVREHKIMEMRGHASEVCGLDWRVDGQMLASGGNDNIFQIWDSRSTTPLITKAEHKSAIRALAWCPWQTNLLATGGGSQDRQIHFWNAANGNKLSSIDADAQITGIIWSKHYKELLTTTGFPDNHLSLWHYPTLRKIANLEGHDARVLYYGLSPDGETVVTGAPDHTLKFWHVWEPKNKSTAKFSSKMENGSRCPGPNMQTPGSSSKADPLFSYSSRVNIR